MKIKFSDESLSDLRSIEEYLLENWNVQIFDDFLTKLDEITEILSKGHVTFQKYENTEYHKILVTKHNTLIYIIENDIMKIIRILQNFQNPEENYKSLKK